MKKLTDDSSDEYPVKARVSEDSEDLGYCGNENFVIGYVPEVNGSGACEVPEFVPTKHELIQIVKYWYQRLLDIQFWYFATGQTGSSEWRITSYARRRIGRISDILPEPELNHAIKEFERDFKQKNKISDDDWNIFENGTPEQWRSYQDNFWREFKSQNTEKPDADAEKS